jgi:UDP-N-acetylmuramoyl-L-alanyl-D-glutamate--2,6-diaminopimelate ligase
MGAVGAAILLGIDPRAIERGIASLGAVRGRFEPVPGEDGLMVIVDYAHKPDALEKLLKAVRELAPDRKLVTIFGCGGDRDQGKRPLMGEIAGRLSDHAVLTSDNPRSESPEAILVQIEQGIRKVGGASYEMIEDRRAAIADTIAEADPHSVIVVAGKGHENYQVVGDRIIHFDDREEVELALRKRTQKSVS